MTFGQKLKALRKEHRYSQEELAQMVDVSRQAVSKWESDRGIPEINKLVKISTIFGVTLDYLLKTDNLENLQQSNGYYVSRETIDGFLSYKRQGAKRIVIGVDFIVLSNLFGSIYNDNSIATILYWITLSGGIAVLIWHVFQPKRYKEIGTKQLLFDDLAIKELRQKHDKNRKRYVIMIIMAIITLIVGPAVIKIVFENSENSIAIALSWILHAVWLSLIILAITVLHAESVIAQNTEFIEKKSRQKYTWIYTAIPITVIAVVIGIFTNAWNPVIPIIVLFCGLLVTVCKILLEGRNKNE